jgi:hypothetical protein
MINFKLYISAVMDVRQSTGRARMMAVPDMSIGVVKISKLNMDFTEV